MGRFMQLSRMRFMVAPLLAAMSCAVPCHAQPRMEVGVGVHMGDYPLAATESTLQALDIGFRGDVPWKDIEVSAGNLRYPTSASPLKNLDTLVTDSVRQQHKPLLILAYGNKAYDDGGLITSSQGIAGFARYAAFTVAHFKGRVYDFEIWNEWNHGLGSQPGRRIAGDPRQYVNLLRASYQSIKQVNPQARVIGGAVAGTDTGWITQFAQSEGLKYLDGISVHPYVHCNARAVPRPPANLKLSGQLGPATPGGHLLKVATGEPTFSPIGGTPEQSIAWLDQLKSLLDKYSQSRPIPVYVTEIGWPTSYGQCGVPQAIAAAYLQRFMLLAVARPWIAGVWWYDLFDDGDDPGNRENRFGLAAKDRSPKAAYKALSAINGLLNSAQTPTAKIEADGSIVVAGSDAGGKSYSATWLPTDIFDTARALGPGSDPAAISATPFVMVHK